jgi:hypothetical protein
MCTCPPFAKLSALGELGNFIKGDAVKNSKCTVCGHCTIHSSTNLPKILLSEGHWNVWNELVCGLDHSDSPMYCLTVRISLFTFYHSWWNEGSEISIALTNYIIESNINSNNYHSVHVYCTYAWWPTWCNDVCIYGNTKMWIIHGICNVMWEIERQQQFMDGSFLQCPQCILET